MLIEFVLFLALITFLKSEQCIVNVGFVELAQFCCHLVDDVKTEP